MDGGTVYRFAVEKMTEVAKEVIAEGGRTPDWLVLHQANSRIIGTVRKQLGISAERTVLSIAKHGNTSAASILWLWPILRLNLKTVTAFC